MIAMRIVRDVARLHLLTFSQVKGNCKKPRYVAARMEIARRLKSERKLSSGQIGRMINRSSWQVQYYLRPEYRRRTIARKMARYFAGRAAEQGSAA
jgi:CII-binding regulator of phage lambda lysogenization HflD